MLSRPTPPSRARSPFHRRLARAAIAALAAIAIPALIAASPAAAEAPLVGLLTGGELRSKGTGTLRTDEIASDFTRDPATPENCIGPMCNDRRDLTFHQQATLRWDTTWLLDGRYPGAPADPEASANAIR